MQQTLVRAMQYTLEYPCSYHLSNIASTIRSFLSLVGFLDRLEAKPRLYLEFKDVASMHGFICLIKRDFHSTWGLEFTYNDDLVEFLYNGVSFVLTCKQIIYTESGEPAKYCNIQFVEYVPKDFSPPSGGAANTD